jgi:hypothetical protein
MNTYYVYAYLDEDGTPYYIGKGKNNRAYGSYHHVTIPPRTQIKILESGLTETESLFKERMYIKQYGRLDLGTGTLKNKREGGQGRLACKNKPLIIPQRPRKPIIIDNIDLDFERQVLQGLVDLLERKLQSLDVT